MSIEVTFKDGIRLCNIPCPHGMRDKDGDTINVGTHRCMACDHRLEPKPHKGFVNCGLGDIPANSPPRSINIMEFI